jgi:ribosomal peptide maturation radical SAM protein 1
MYKITLVNMPFATVRMPSLALTQLKAVLEERFGAAVAVRVLYLNHDFAHHLGLSLYADVSESLQANMSGLGDWFFRDQAFPGLPDNSEDYLRRYFPARGAALESRRRLLLAKRAGLDGFLARLIARHRLAEDSLVGFTSMFSQNVACLALARKLKERRPEIVTVMGGANCEAPMGGNLAAHVEAIDFVFSGPSLHSFPELVGNLLAGDEAGCHAIQGVFSRRNFAPERLTGPASIGKELDIDAAIPLDYEPFLDAMDAAFADSEVRPVLLFETSRGCWWGERSHCTFCGLNGTSMAYRSMQPERAVALFQDMFERYSGRCARFESVDNILPRSYLKEVFPRLAPPPHVTLFYEVKADLKPHEMEVLARARVVELQPGIESLSTSTLKLMRKGTTAFQNLNFMKNCVTYGLRPMWNLLLGFPGETLDVYEKYVADIPSLLHLPPPFGAFPVRFDRFSPYFMHAAEYGLELRPSDSFQFIYPFDEETLAGMVYYFVDHNYRATYLATLAEWNDRIQAQVDRWRARWERRDGGLAPCLHALPGGDAVLDTRSGEAVRHELGPAALRALDFLALPRKAADLAEHLAGDGGGGAGSEGADPAALLADLVQRRLVFVERDLAMSLLLPPPREAAA